MNTKKNSNNTIPSCLVKLFSPNENIPSAINTINKDVNNNAIGNSFLTVLFLTVKEWIRAHAPNIKKVFNIFEPITLPNIISPLLLINDWILTANSGALVPNATIVNPISIGLNLKFLAKDEAPSTKISAPYIRIINPTININKLTIIINHFPYNSHHHNRHHHHLLR